MWNLTTVLRNVLGGSKRYIYTPESIHATNVGLTTFFGLSVRLCSRCRFIVWGCLLLPFRRRERNVYSKSFWFIWRSHWNRALEHKRSTYHLVIVSRRWNRRAVLRLIIWGPVLYSEGLVLLVEFWQFRVSHRARITANRAGGELGRKNLVWIWGKKGN